LKPSAADREPIVISGIGLMASVGNDRESVWQAICQGKSGVRRLTGFPGLPDDRYLGAPVDLMPSVPGRLKAISLCERTAFEALRDAGISFAGIDRTRFGCAISTHMGDLRYIEEKALHELGRDIPADYAAGGEGVSWHDQFIPSSACSYVGNRFGLWGPRMCHAAACASGTVDVLAAVRAIRDDQCDIVLAGAADFIHPLMAAGFRQMRVLADHEDPTQACRPFDAARNGFVMGEGGAMMVVERLSHALARGARIYAEIAGGKLICDAHHVTSLDEGAEGMTYAIRSAMKEAGLAPEELDYINTHGTGTTQNDVTESHAIRQALGSIGTKIPASANKSMLGHLVNAAGAVELAITALALRDGFVPPTLNLTTPDPRCELDHVALVGRPFEPRTALKLSVAFGGHLTALVLRRWNDAGSSLVARPIRAAA